MEPKPKERIVFDEDSYYGDEGAEWAVNDLIPHEHPARLPLERNGRRRPRRP